MTGLASQGWGRLAFSSMNCASSSWSRLPQLTPMRTTLSYFIAASIICANCRSFLSPLPTLPGLMRYLDSACAIAGCSVSSRWPL